MEMVEQGFKKRWDFSLLCRLFSEGKTMRSALSSKGSSFDVKSFMEIAEEEKALFFESRTKVGNYVEGFTGGELD